MLVSLIDGTAAGLAVARGHIEKSLRRMRPGILNVGGKPHHILLGKGCALDIKIVKRELWPDAGVKHRLSFHRLTKGFSRRGNAAGDERGERATIDHDGPRGIVSDRRRAATRFCGLADTDRRGESLTKLRMRNNRVSPSLSLREPQYNPRVYFGYLG